MFAEPELRVSLFVLQIARVSEFYLQGYKEEMLRAWILGTGAAAVGAAGCCCVSMAVCVSELGGWRCCRELLTFELNIQKTKQTLQVKGNQRIFQNQPLRLYRNQTTRGTTLKLNQIQISFSLHSILLSSSSCSSEIKFNS